MSFCDEDVAVNCDECYELTVGDCLPQLITTNLTPSTDYYLICTDKFGNRYDVAFTSTAGGDFYIDPDDFPSKLFNQFAGKFEFVVSLSAVTVTPVSMTIGGSTYSCIIAEWTLTCCNNTYVPPTACDTFIDGLSTTERECICDNIAELCENMPCDDATVKNSDNTFSQSIASGATYVLTDETITIQLDGVDVATSTFPAMTNPTFLINWN